MHSFANDLKYALRSLRQRPGFTATVVAALTLGIGVNVAIFSVVNTVLLKPLPIPDQDRLVWPENTQNGVPVGFVASPAKFLFWRAQTDVFQDVAAFRDFALNYSGTDTPEQLPAQQVSESFFRVYGARISRGRSFTLEEDLPGGPKVAVISHKFWQRHLNGAEDVLGTTLPLNGDRYTIIGITGSELDLRDFASDPDVWVPFQIDPNSTSQATFIGAGARLKPGVTLAEAQVRLAASAAVYREQFPGALQKDAGFTVLPLSEAIVLGDARKGLWVLLGAVGFVLLVACANVANLMLARANGRRREIAIRSTLGAGRWRIVRQLLAESVLVALLSGVLGLTVGFVGMRALLSVNTADLIRLGQGGTLMTLDWRIVTFAVVVSLVTAVLFGLVPALINSRPNLNAVIKDSTGPSGSGFGQRRARSVLVAVEVGLAVMLLIGAALMIRTSIALTNVDPGFDPTNTVVMRTSLSGSRFESAESVTQITRAALERVRAMPGVASAAATCCVPLQGGMGLPFKIQGRADNGSPVTGGAGYITVSPDYFKTFGIQVVRGRSFLDSDNAGALPVAIINETMAKRLWPNDKDPLDDSILLGANAAEAFKGEPIRRIIGVVRDVAWYGLGNAPGPIMYEPIAQMPDGANAFVSNLMPLTWVVRSTTPSAALQNAVQSEIRQAIGLPVVSVQSMEDVVKVSTSRQRLNMLLMSVFGGAALLLAAIGIYGLIAYSVQQRKHEIGIRMALGADRGHIQGAVLREGLLVTAGGVAAGLLASFYMANVLAALLFEVKPRDPVAFVAVPAVLALVALFAVWLPAVRASRVSPLDALRYE
jgi:predicted permease